MWLQFYMQLFISIIRMHPVFDINRTFQLFISLLNIYAGLIS